MTEQWKELKETIIEMRDNDGAGTQQEVCKFLANLMDVLEKQMNDGWIHVSERLPEAGKQYLCCNEDGFREVGYLSKVTGEWGFTDTEAFGEAIAWMPLPEPL